MDIGGLDTAGRGIRPLSRAPRGDIFRGRAADTKRKQRGILFWRVRRSCPGIVRNQPDRPWSFDGTVSGGTLYEYTGVEQPGEAGEREPYLVGVEGGVGSRTLISRCGTRLGSSAHEEALENSMCNAISASGERVFFTAVECPSGPAVNELYARLTDGEASETLSTSEPPLSGPGVIPGRLCTGPCSEAENEENRHTRASATFRGASRDGSKAFFTIEQELLPGARGDNLYEDELSGSGRSLQ